MQSELNGPQREEKYYGYNHDCDDRWDELSVTFQQAGMIVVLGDQKAKVERWEHHSHVSKCIGQTGKREEMQQIIRLDKRYD